LVSKNFSSLNFDLTTFLEVSTKYRKWTIAVYRLLSIP
jgi:hypothetical protein